VDWPWGNTSYLYGAYFHAYLAATYGDAALGRLADATAKRLPYLGSGAYEEVFGESLGSLWSTFERATRSAATPHRSEATRLTSHGFFVAAPLYGANGRLFYSTSNPHGFPALRELGANGESREVTTKVGSGRFGTAGNIIVFDQLEYIRSVGLQSDLYDLDTASGVVRRLTHELRAADPDVTADGERLVFVLQAADRRTLATMPRNGTAPRHLISAPDTHFASPRWSPDGRSIAAERRVRGGPSEIVLVDAATADLRVISGRGRSIEPSWTPDGRGLLYASATADGFEVQHVDVTTGARRRLVNAGASARSPVLSPDGATLVFVGYSVDGYDLFSLPSSAAEWAPVADDHVASQAVPAHAELGGFVSTVEDYRPWPMLRPRFWTPILATDSDEWTVGAATAGADALGRHAYAAGAAWSTRARPDWYAGYVYDRWRPTVFLSASDDTDPWRQGTVRTREVDGGVSTPFRTVRRTQALSASLHLSNDRVRCDPCERPVDTTIRRHALRGGWTFTTARTYGYSISREAGVTLSAGGEWAPRALGSTGASNAIVADARAFLPAAPRHGIVALRAAGATAWGDDGAVRTFGAGGAGRETVGVSFDRDAIGLIRGVDVDAVAGPWALVVNADYRLPLVWVERGVGTWPAFVRSLHGALFVDAGAAWDRRLSREQLRLSTGVELAADLVIGYVAPLTVAGGVAWRHDPSGASSGAAVFARLGRAF
jgi:hypothetical protein